MGANAQATICYGVAFRERFEFPWDSEEFDGEENWWLSIHGVDPHDFSDGWSDTRRMVLEANPMPFELVRQGGYDVYDPYLVVPSLGIGVDWDRPNEIPSDLLSISEEQEKDVIAFIDFLYKYIKPDPDGYYDLPEFKPKWYLTCFYG